MYIILCIVLQYIYQYTTILPVVIAIMYVDRYGTVGIQYHGSTDYYELQGFTLCWVLYGTTTTVAL